MGKPVPGEAYGDHVRPEREMVRGFGGRMRKVRKGEIVPDPDTPAYSRTHRPAVSGITKPKPPPHKRMRQQGKQAALWKAFRDEFHPALLEQQGPICAWPGCNREWTDVHHLCGRGSSPATRLDGTIMVGLCSPHNTEAESGPGYKMGMRFHSWEVHEARVAAAKIRGLPEPACENV